jgi:hypothetical protein
MLAKALRVTTQANLAQVDFVHGAWCSNRSARDCHAEEDPAAGAIRGH